METQPWEALDVDDTDLPVLVRCSALLPSKRPPPPPPPPPAPPPPPPSQQLQQQQPPQPERIYSSNTQSLSQEPCSQLRCFSQSQPITHDSEALEYHSIPSSPRVEEREEPSSTSARRLIPGPAGAVQAAMHRLDRNRQNFSTGEERIPTQEYLRRAQEEGEDDEDFKRNPWLCAIDFLQSEGADMGKGGVMRTPLCSIKTRFGSDRVLQVVAVIKSCTSNGLGDLIVTLKDPTGTIGASVHRKVLTNSEFGRSLSVGAVIILQKVAVFSPSCSAQYLNVTLNNVVRVISKDCGPSSRRTYPASTVRFASAAADTGECRGIRSRMAEKSSPVRRIAPEEILRHTIRMDGNEVGTVDADRQLKKHDPAIGSFNFHSSSRHGCAAALEKFLAVRQETIEKISKGTAKKDANSEAEKMADNGRCPDEGTPLQNINGISGHKNASVAENSVNESDECEIESIGIKNQRQQEISKASVPQWTDEQLEELFAAGFDDDTFLL
ncbi:PREDICTED: uncharacterized protein C17orf53 homolog [Nelumbo nucifera]|uniref:Uncharacterized protein C17orf53 homolog n=1 Tax=Nelumbo nucifera TaxID=4432 RepID=A0A1U8ABQ1_NELNU|nr:PREDICTED: uncharacterized protein C17orf53 homolog [Nelumbo nucifera]